MTDHDALLAAIIADPKDDTPRLVYADWLEENGETVECDCCEAWERGKKRLQRTLMRSAGIKKYPAGWKSNRESQPCPQCSGTGRVSDGRAERAEFIRVQVELARLGNRLPYRYPKETFPNHHKGCTRKHGKIRPFEKNGHCKLCRLMRENEAWRKKVNSLHSRERELAIGSPTTWGANGWFSDWLSSLGHQWPGGNENPTWTWHRGFINKLVITWNDWRTHADAILKQQPIERCKLTVIPLNSSAELQAFLEEGDFYCEGDVPDEPVRNLKSRRWPKIEFELPSAGEITFRGHRLVTDATIG